MAKEKHIRSVVKGISWRIIASLTTMMLVFIFTGNLTIVLGVGAFDVISKFILYYVHERAWIAISWGYEKNIN